MASPAQGSAPSGITPLDPDLTTLFAQIERKLGASGQRLTLRRWMDSAESWRILEALRQCRGNRSAAARALGIGRRTLYTKMEKLGIQPSWGPSNGAGPIARPIGPA
jgi:DNA-binding NtrC family response regulator